VAEVDALFESILKRQLFKLADFRAAAQRLGSVRILQAVQDLLELEVHAKSGSQEPYRYYEWLWKLAAPARISKEPKF
jgi:DNA polymerase III delta subunit